MRQIKRTLTLCMILLMGLSGQSMASSELAPVLKITEISEDFIESNSTYDLSITVENVGSSYGKDLSLTLTPDEDSPIMMVEQISYKHVGNVNPNVPFELTYGIRVDSGAEPGFYPLTLEGIMIDAESNQISYTESFMLEVVRGDNDVDFEIVSADDTVLYSDRSLTTKFVLDNNGQGLASDVTVSFGDNEDVGIFTVGDSDRYLASFNSHQKIEFEMELLINEGVSGYVPLDFEVTYDSGISVVTETITTYVSVEESETASVIIKSITKSTNHILPDQEVVFTVVLENTSDINAEYIKLSVGQEADIVAISQSVVILDDIVSGGSETVQFTLQATDSASSMNYPVEFTLEYDELLTTQYSGVYINNDEDEEDDIISKPRMVITDFSISSDKIFVGDTFDIVFSVLNSSKLKDVRNLKVTIDTSSGGSSTESFMPLNQSNSYFVGDLGMEESSEIKIPLKVFANAEAMNYSIEINFEYEDYEGDLYDDSETIHIPVYEKSELTVSDVSVGSSLDNGYTLEVDFYNTGKVDITNMMVDLEGDFQAANSNYYVGDFATGRTDVYDVEIVGSQPDRITGTIIFTYDDTFGEKETYVKEFTIGENVSSELNETNSTTEASARGNRQGGEASTNVNARETQALVELSEDQVAKMAEMSQEERRTYMQSLESGTEENTELLGISPMYWSIIIGSLLVIVGAVVFILRRKNR